MTSAAAGTLKVGVPLPPPGPPAQLLSLSAPLVAVSTWRHTCVQTLPPHLPQSRVPYKDLGGTQKLFVE